MEEKEGWRREADKGVTGGREDGVKEEVGGSGRGIKGRRKRIDEMEKDGEEGVGEM